VIEVRSGSVTTRIYTTEKAGHCYYTVAWNCGSTRHRQHCRTLEQDQEKLTPLRCLKYHNSISDAGADLGNPEQISQVFARFQKHLYEEVA
jgi:hypothetical protein